MVHITHTNALFQNEIPSSMPVIYLTMDNVEKLLQAGLLVFFICTPNSKRNLIPIREGGKEKRGRFLCLVCCQG